MYVYNSENLGNSFFMFSDLICQAQVFVVILTIQNPAHVK